MEAFETSSRSQMLDSKSTSGPSVADAHTKPMRDHVESSSPRRSHARIWVPRILSLFCLPILIATIIVRNQQFPFKIHNILRQAGLPSSSPECSNPPLDSCSFYANCLESRYHCGSTGYPLAYGKKFCEKFSENRQLFDAKGQQWLINTMHCLQLELVAEATGVNATTCEALEDYAFGTHAKCYVDNGVCTLGIDDWEAILEIVDIQTLFQSWDAFKATVEAGLGCGEYFAFMILKKLF